MTGHEIRAMREQLGLTQAALAALLNGNVDGLAVTNVAVSRWESGKHRPTGPALNILRRLAAKPDDDTAPAPIPSDAPAIADYRATITSCEEWIARATTDGDEQGVRTAKSIIRLCTMTLRQFGASA